MDVDDLVGSVDDDSSEAAGTSITEDETPSPRDRTARLSEVSMNISAAPTVTLLRNVPGPRLPKTV